MASRFFALTYPSCNLNPHYDQSHKSLSYLYTVQPKTKITNEAQSGFF